MTTTTRTRKASNDDLRRYEGVVRAQATRLVGTAAMTGALDRDDLLAEGRLAVVEAIEGLVPSDVEDERRLVALRVRHRLIDAIRRLSAYSRGEFRARKASRTPSQSRVCSLDQLLADRERPDVACARPSPETVAASAQLLGIVGRLPAREREALLKRDVEGYSGPEVGSQMGVSESRVCQLRNQALSRVRAHLERDLAA